MKRRICIVLIVLFALLLLPHAASANAPAPDPLRMTVEYKNVAPQTKITVLLAGEDGVFRIGESFLAEQEDGFRRSFYRHENDTQFCIELTAPDGTVLRSNAAALESNGQYTYNADSNVLRRVNGYWIDWLVAGIYLALAAIVYVLPIFLALAVTLLIEFLTALCFRLKPRHYVILINLITNPVMNVILRVISLWSLGASAYWIALAILELIVCGIEFWFYTRKYRDRKKWVLLLFTLVANALSAASGLLLFRVLL